MAINLSSFVPTDQIGPGRNGLHGRKGSTSTARLMGSGLTDGLNVTVLFPCSSQNPTIKWTGTTFNSNPANTACDVNLEEQLENRGPELGIDFDDTVTVSVTATDGTTTSNTIAPTITTAS
ncbi:MAG: hypothetical protein ACYC61_32950 [Isosphaeraceae bacterium]